MLAINVYIRGKTKNIFGKSLFHGILCRCSRKETTWGKKQQKYSQNQGKGKILNEIYFHEYNTGSF